MTRAVRTVTRGHTVRDLSDMFERDDFNSYPVEEDAQVIGIVTKFDLLKCFVFTPSQMVPPYEQLMSRTVGDVMTAKEAISAPPLTALPTAVPAMTPGNAAAVNAAA